MKHVALDFCCGDGGFTDGLVAAGFYVVGFDVRRFPGWRGDEFVQCDLLNLGPRDLAGLNPVVAFAGPPCEQYSRHGMPWLRKKNSPLPDPRLVDQCFELASSLGIPVVLENVVWAQKFIGQAAAHYGPHYLWGDVPALLPHFSMYSKRKKESFSSRDRHLRARVPFELAHHLALAFLPAGDTRA